MAETRQQNNITITYNNYIDWCSLNGNGDFFFVF